MPRRPKTKPTARRQDPPDAARVAALEEAWGSTDPLPAVLDLMPEEGTAEQRVVVYACDCVDILKEDPDFGLWDALNTLAVAGYKSAVAQMSAVLKTVGADRTSADFGKLAAAFKRAIGEGADELDAYSAVADSPLAERINRAARAHAREIEDSLLLFCRSRLRKLAAAAPCRQEMPPRARLSKMREALSSEDALGSIRELIPDDGRGAQEVVVYAFGCILETNSAGLPILFDRFDDDELAKIRRALETIKATETLAALGKLQRLLDQAIGKGASRTDAADSLPDQPAEDSDACVQEMQQGLLAFCRAHMEELAAG